MRFIYLLLIFFTSCQLIPTNPVLSSNATNQVIIPLSPEEQKIANEAFLKNVAGRKYFGAQIDIWGGGALRLRLYFDEKGTIYDAMKDYGDSWYPMHAFVKALSPTNAYYYMLPSASYKLADIMYEVVINGDKVYRTTAAWGLTKNNKPTSEQNPGWLYTDDYKIQHNGIDTLMQLGEPVKEFPTSRSMPNQKVSPLQQQGYSQEEIYNILKNL